jgi:hypothetical protein
MRKTMRSVDFRQHTGGAQRREPSKVTRSCINSALVTGTLKPAMGELLARTLLAYG